MTIFVSPSFCTTIRTECEPVKYVTKHKELEGRFQEQYSGSSRIYASGDLHIQATLWYQMHFMESVRKLQCHKIYSFSSSRLWNKLHVKKLDVWVKNIAKRATVHLREGIS